MLSTAKSTLTTERTPAWDLSLDWRFLFVPRGVLDRVAWFVFWMDRNPNGSFHSFEIFAALLKYEDYEIMPRGKSKKNGSKSDSGRSNPKMLGWVNVKLDDADEPEIARIADDTGKLAVGILELLDAGCDLGVKRQDDGETSMAYLVGWLDNGEDERVGLSAHASSPRDALACLLYKYFGKLDGVLPRPENSTERRFR